MLPPPRQEIVYPGLERKQAVLRREPLHAVQGSGRPADAGSEEIEQGSRFVDRQIRPVGMSPDVAEAAPQQRLERLGRPESRRRQAWRGDTAAGEKRFQ